MTRAGWVIAFLAPCGAETLAEHIRAYGCPAEAAGSIEAGVARAMELGGTGPVCALGTLYFSGDVRQAFAAQTKG